LIKYKITYLYQIPKEKGFVKLNIVEEDEDEENEK
jgi:hypothetical protein